MDCSEDLKHLVDECERLTKLVRRLAPRLQKASDRLCEVEQKLNRFPMVDVCDAFEELMEPSE